MYGLIMLLDLFILLNKGSKNLAFSMKNKDCIQKSK